MHQVELVVRVSVFRAGVRTGAARGSHNGLSVRAGLGEALLWNEMSWSAGYRHARAVLAG